MSELDTTCVGQLEQHLLLRLPPHVAQQVHKAISTDTLEERLQIQMEHDGRRWNIRFDDNTLFGKVWDLPCVVDVNKTLDKKTVYKSGSIGQMVICSEDPLDLQVENINDLTLKQRNQLQRRYQYKHGITLPLKNVRKKRFRKTAMKKLIDSPEIESEVRRLLKEDAEAVNVEFELLTDEEAKQPGTPSTPMETSDSPSAEVPSEAQIRSTNPITSPASEMNLIGEVSSSDEEDKPSAAGNQGEIQLEEVPEPVEEVIEEQLDLIHEKETDPPQEPLETDDGRKIELEEELLRASEQLENLQVKLNKQKSRIMDTTNPFLKERFTRELNELEEEEQRLMREENEIRNKIIEISN